MCYDCKCLHIIYFKTRSVVLQADKSADLHINSHPSNLLYSCIFFLQVLFKRFLGDATYGQVSLFLTMLALLNLVLLWPIMLGLYYGKRETLDWNNLPWAFLCGTSALGIGKSGKCNIMPQSHLCIYGSRIAAHLWQAVLTYISIS